MNRSMIRAEDSPIICVMGRIFRWGATSSWASFIRRSRSRTLEYGWSGKRLWTCSAI